MSPAMMALETATLALPALEPEVELFYSAGRIERRQMYQR